MLDTIGLSSGARYRSRGSPSLVFGGSTYLVVWEDAGVVRGGRVTREGSVLDPTGFTMSLSGAQSPVNAFDGTNYLGVWNDGVDVIGTRVTQAGGLLDGHGFQIARHGPPPPPPPPPPCSGRITIPEIGPAAPYPSTCSISGLSGTITDANLVLNGLSHFTPDDIDILLVGPQGQDAMMMSDAGGGFALNEIDLTLDDQAAGPLPDSTEIGPGSYRPANYEPGDPFPAPAPTPTGNVALSTFDGTSPNGTWSLYVVDDALGSIGSINGWRLQITTAGGPPRRRRLRLRLAATATTAPASAPSAATPAPSAATPAPSCRPVRGPEGGRPDASESPHTDPCEALLCRSHPPCSLQAGGPRDCSEPEAGQEARARQQGEPVLGRR